MAQAKTIIVGITGSIAAYKSTDIIRRLRKKGYRTPVIMTRAGEEFITPLTLATVSGEKVWRSMFENEAEQRMISHLSLAESADVLLIAPASADMIGKMANGLADDLLSAVAMATPAHIIIAPAMNDKMWSNRIVQRNCDLLKKQGMQFVGPAEGELACGTAAIGRLADSAEIVSAVQQACS